MITINSLLTSIADFLFSRLADRPPIILLAVVATITGVAVAIVFRYTSQQQALRRVTDLSRAQLLAIKLFKDDVRTVFSSLGKIFFYSALRVWYSLPPVLVMLIPFVLLFVQLARWFELEPLVAGDQAVLEIQLSDEGWNRRGDLRLTSTAGIEIQTQPLHEAATKSVFWRIFASSPARPATVQWRLGDQHGEKRVIAADADHRFRAVDRRLAGGQFLDRLFHPGEVALDRQAAVSAITVHYAARRSLFVGEYMPWWLTFLVISSVAAILVRPLVGVEF